MHRSTVAITMMHGDTVTPAMRIAKSWKPAIRGLKVENSFWDTVLDLDFMVTCGRRSQTTLTQEYQYLFNPSRANEVE